MNSLERLAARIGRKYPSATVALDAPARKTGTAWLDVKKGASYLHIAWNAKHGFGVSSHDPDAYGMGHDEVFPDLASTWKRVDSLLRSGRRTRDPIASAQRGARQAKRPSQADRLQR